MAEVKDSKKVVLQNRGKRHFDLGGGRRVSPGEVVEVTAEEAERLSAYGDLVDMSKVVKAGGVNQAEAAKLRKDNDALALENAKLKEQLAAAHKEVKPKKGK